MSTFASVIACFFGLILYLFLFWRRMHEDWDSPLVFSFGIISAFGLLVGGLLAEFLIGARMSPSYAFEPGGLWFWGAFAGFFIFFLIASYRCEGGVREAFDASVPGLIIWYGFLLLSDFLTSTSWTSLAGGIISAFFVVFYYYMNFSYKRFTWYKSGKVGFSGFATLGLLFLLRIVPAILGVSVFSLAGRIDGVVSGAVAFLMFFLLYNLS